MLLSLIKDSYDNVEAIVVDTETEYLQSYNETSFLVSNGSENLSFLIEIESATKVKLNLDTPSTFETYTVQAKLYDSLSDLFEFTGSIDYSESSTTETNETEEGSESSTEGEETTTEETTEGTGEEAAEDVSLIENVKIKAFKDKFLLQFENIDNKADSVITIEKYSLENFLDFTEDEELISFSESGNYNYIFEKDFIYLIKININNKNFVENFINGKPTCYYSSVYHLKQMSDKFDLKIQSEGTFDTKLLIWQYSKNAVEFAGTIHEKLNDEKKSFLNNYITHKVFAKLLAKNLIDSSYQKDLLEIEQNINSSSKKIKLSEFELENSDSSSTTDSSEETNFSKITSSLKLINEEIERLEASIMKNFAVTC